MISSSTSFSGSAQSTFSISWPLRINLVGTNLRRAKAAARWDSYSTKAYFLGFDLSVCERYRMTSRTPSVSFSIESFEKKATMSLWGKNCGKSRRYFNIFGGHVVGNSADPQLVVVQGHQNAESLVFPDFIVVQLSYRSLGIFSTGVTDEEKASVRSREVHHQAKLVNLANLRVGEKVRSTAFGSDKLTFEKTGTSSGS